MQQITFKQALETLGISHSYNGTFSIYDYRAGRFVNFDDLHACIQNIAQHYALEGDELEGDKLDAYNVLEAAYFDTLEDDE